MCSLAILLTAGSCEKSAQKQLPPATQTGANTFGCLINGKPFTATRASPKGMSGLSDGTVYYVLNVSQPGLFIDASPWERDAPIGIDINIPEFRGVGVYKEDQFSIYIFSIVPNTNSHVNITRFDNGIVSGTFQAEVTGSNEKKISITHGRFDLKK